MSFGPAGPDTAATRIERRAAEIALHGSRGIKLWGELDGWVMRSGRGIGGAKRDRSTPSNAREWAGWLAHCIWTTS